MAAWAVTFPVSIRCHVELWTSGMNQDTSDWELSVFLTRMGTGLVFIMGKHWKHSRKAEKKF